METNERLLQFAVELTQRKIAPRYLTKLRKHLKAFVGSDDYSASPVSGFATRAITSTAPLPEDYSIRDFQILQADADPILRSVAQSKHAKIYSPEGVDVKLTLSPCVISRKSFRAVTFAEGSTRDVFRFKLALLLGVEPANRILSCAATDCERIFYRRRRQEFCSIRCSNRIYMREKRKNESWYRDDENDAAHKRYEKRVGRKVSRRARKAPVK